MNGYKKNNSKLLSELALLDSVSEQSWKQLLKKEKDRRGVKHNKLVFIGMANVAHYWWCAARTLIRSRGQEVDFFRAYLVDRLRYSIELGRIKKLPRRQPDWLEVGSEPTLRDLEELLDRREKETKGISVVTMGVEKDGVMYINPALVPEEAEMYRDYAREKGLRVANVEEDVMLRGEMLETGNWLMQNLFMGNLS